MNKPIKAGDKVVRDTKTQDPGRVRVGDGAPVFVPERKPD